MEEWKKTGYEGYEVSNYGQVKSIKRKVQQGNRLLSVKETILKQNSDKRGYKIVRIPKIGTVTVHRLVLKAFIENTENKPQCNHKDGDKTNNNVSNLEWMTNRENHIHAINTGLHVSVNGENHGHSKITEQIVKHARELCVFNKKSTNSIAKEIGLNKASCREMLTGQTWKHIPYLIEECKRVLKSKKGTNQYSKQKE